MSAELDEDERDRLREEGRAEVYRELLAEALRGLARPDLPGDVEGLRRRVAALELERASTVTALREVCEEHGDTDWADDLYLPDVIERHLARHLDDSRSDS